MLECGSSPEPFARELEMASCVHRRYLRNITNHIGDESGSDGYVSQDSLIDCSDDEHTYSTWDESLLKYILTNYIE